MSSSDFLRRARKRPAPENFDTHQEEIKRIAPSTRTNKPTYLHRSKPSTTFRVLTPVPSTSWSWDTESQSSHTGGHQPHQARAQPPAHRYLTPKRAGYKAAAKRTHPSDPSNEQFSRMTKETTKHKLTQPTMAEGVEIVYTKNIFEAETWLRTHITDCSASAVGFDIEWKQEAWRHREQDCRSSTGS